MYVYRVLLTGIHLMRTGEVQANLAVLNQQARLRHVDELIARKTMGAEQGVLPASDLAFHEREQERLLEELKAAAAASALPSEVTVEPALHDFLLRVRLAGWRG